MAIIKKMRGVFTIPSGFTQKAIEKAKRSIAKWNGIDNLVLESGITFVAYDQSLPHKWLRQIDSNALQNQTHYVSMNPVACSTQATVDGGGYFFVNNENA